MKKLLLISLVLIIGATGFSQNRRAVVPKSLQDIKVPYKAAVVDNDGPIQSVNVYVSTKSVLDATVIGNTFYDSQTNGTVGQRIYVTDEGKMAAVWTRGITSTSYPDRGTGYNYNDGTGWGPAPTARIEAVRCGWPSIAQWGPTGEVVVAHQSGTLPLLLSKRDVAGTGAWTTINVLPPSGAPNPLWPSICTSGPNHEYIHILTMTAPVANGGAIYNGLDGALIYYRSSDGGATWEKNGIQLPTLVSPDYYAFSADSYTWMEPHGDTIAFAYGENWSDEFIMWSPDKGDTWNRIEVLTNQYKNAPTGTVALPFYASDGASSLAMDKNGTFHLTFGRMRASDDGTGRVWYPYNDGLIYWNSLMGGPIQDSLDLDTLDVHHQLIGYVTSDAAGDSILSIPYYNSNMSGYSSITVDDESQRIFVTYAGVVVENPSNGVNFRHIKANGTNDYLTNPTMPTWRNNLASVPDPVFVDFNSGIDDMYLEFVFPSMAKKTTTNNIHYITQSSDVPGSNIIQTTVPVHDNNIIYNNPDKDAIVLSTVGVKEKDNTVASVSNFPNPFRGNTNISIGMNKAGNATLQVATITGQVVRTADLGNLSQGVNQVVFDGSSLNAGVYIYTVTVNGVAHAGRMIVR